METFIYKWTQVIQFSRNEFFLSSKLPRKIGSEDVGQELKTDSN